jgi:predicted RNase H-like nuclease (RuvC/YqgF family)
LLSSKPTIIEHVHVETCDDSITKENKELKEEVERLKRELIQLKRKCNAQPSQDNREYMVKLEKGLIEVCMKPHQEGHKSNVAKSRGNLEKCNLSKMHQFHSRLQRF